MTLLANPLGTPTPLTTRVVWSPVVELVIAHWVLEMEAEDRDSFIEWDRLQALAERTPLTEDSRAFMGEHHGAGWLHLVPIIDESGALSLAELIDHVRGIDPAALYQGFKEAADKCAGNCDHEALTVSDPTEWRREVLTVLECLNDEIGDRLDEFHPVLRHDAELTAFLQRRLTVPQLVESVTNGIAYMPEAGVEEIVLLPSVLMRPFNLMMRQHRSLYLIYSASDESMGADVDTPPAWMIQLFKALSDEKRLRLLRHLASGPASLGDLVEYVGLAKSTTHHHLRLLRAAGLVRHSIASEKDESFYELRTDTLPAAVASVTRYLDPGSTQ